MRRLRLLLFILMVAGCAYREQLIYNPVGSIPQSAQGLPPSRIEALIVQAGAAHGWTMLHIEPGHLQASHEQKQYSAVVDITFDAATWHINYKTSNGLRAQDGHIHSHYNVWIRNLEHDIDAQLSTASR